MQQTTARHAVSRAPLTHPHATTIICVCCNTLNTRMLQSTDTPAGRVLRYKPYALLRERTMPARSCLADTTSRTCSITGSSSSAGKLPYGERAVPAEPEPPAAPDDDAPVVEGGKQQQRQQQQKQRSNKRVSPLKCLLFVCPPDI